MTQGHSTDLPILEHALKHHDFPYLGVIGSKAKALNMKKELRERGLTEELVNKFICPIGDPIGDNSPIEISFSIISQLLRNRDQIYQTAKRS